MCMYFGRRICFYEFCRRRVKFNCSQSDFSLRKTVFLFYFFFCLLGLTTLKHITDERILKSIDVKLLRHVATWHRVRVFKRVKHQYTLYVCIKLYIYSEKVSESYYTRKKMK